MLTVISLIVTAAAAIILGVVSARQQARIDKCFYLLSKCIDRYSRQGVEFEDIKERMRLLDMTCKSALNHLEEEIHSPYFGTESEEPEGEVWSND